MKIGTVSEYRIVKGKVVLVKTIHFAKPDNHGGNVIITKTEEH